MRQATREFRVTEKSARNQKTGTAAMWTACSLIFALTLFAMPLSSFAESRTGTSSASASVNFRIVIPAIIRVTGITQPDQISIEDRHVAQGYIDLEAATSVRLTTNSRAGYLLSAAYDSQLLSGVEVRIANQSLTASSGTGDMRVVAGLQVDKLVPVSYRLYLAPGVQAGAYRWPVSLAFSLAAT